jgi:hypothetical protein
VHFPVHLSLSLHRVILCAFIATEPPYHIPHPKELTHRLHTNWLCHRAQNRQNSHSLEPAQVEQHVPSTHNINSDFLSNVATSTAFIDRRGEHNVPRRYLKDAEWHKDRYLGTGYYCSDPDSENTAGLTAIKFNFKTLQWGLLDKIENQYRITRPAPIKYRLQIFDEERTNRSRWGPIDRTEEEEPLASTFRFRSDREDTPDPDTNIPSNELEQHTIAALAQLIPTHITRPNIPSIGKFPLLASRMSQIASTTTLSPTSILARTLGAGVSAGGTQSANMIRNVLGGGGRLGGGPPKDTGRTGPPRGPPQREPDDNPDAGGGGNPRNPGGGGNPGQPLNNPEDRLTDKLIRREPEIFDRDQAKVEGFMTKWNVYRPDHLVQIYRISYIMYSCMFSWSLRHLSS